MMAIIIPRRARKLAWPRLSLVVALTIPVAHADEAAQSDKLDLSGGKTIVSDYRFRGGIKYDRMSAIQGYVEIAHPSGVYGGVWGSTFPNKSDYGHSEIDLYAGWTGPLSGRISARAELIYNFYPYAKAIPDFETN